MAKRHKRRTPKRGAHGRFVKARHNPTRSHHRRSRGRSRKSTRHYFRRHHYRHNPTGRIGSMLQGTVGPVLIGAGGAIVADVAIGLLPVPAVLQSPVAKPMVKAAVAAGLGIIAGMMTNRATGMKVMTGGLIVVSYDVLRGLVQKVAPQVPLGGLAEYPAISYAQPGVGEVFFPGGSPMLDVNAASHLPGQGVGEVFDQWS